MEREPKLTRLGATFWSFEPMLRLVLLLPAVVAAGYAAAAVPDTLPAALVIRVGVVFLVLSVVVLSLTAAVATSSSRSTE